MLKKIYSLVAVFALAATCLTPADAFNASHVVNQIGNVLQSATASAPAAVPSEGTTEIGFSPDQGALDLVLKTINSANTSLDVMAYSFTSAEVTRALLQAKRRNVQIRVLVDYDQNFKTTSRKTVSALSSLVTAGVQVKSIDAYAIFHDKVIIADHQHVQTGSFNYSQAAAKKNSENVIVLWHAKKVAAEYDRHFARNWQLATTFAGR